MFFVPMQVNAIAKQSYRQLQYRDKTGKVTAGKQTHVSEKGTVIGYRKFTYPELVLSRFAVVMREGGMEGGGVGTKLLVTALKRLTGYLQDNPLRWYYLQVVAINGCDLIFSIGNPPTFLTPVEQRSKAKYRFFNAQDVVERTKQICPTWQPDSVGSVPLGERHLVVINNRDVLVFDNKAEVVQGTGGADIVVTTFTASRSFFMVKRTHSRKKKARRRVA